MRRNKRQRPDIDVFYAPPVASSDSQIPPQVVHRHTAFEANASGSTRISHNHVYVTVPGVASPPEAAPDTIHNMDSSDSATSTEGIPHLSDVEDDEEEEDDEYPYNWMDPNFVQGQTTTNDTTDKRPKRKPRLATVRSTTPHLGWIPTNGVVGHSVASFCPQNRSIPSGDHSPGSAVPRRLPVHCVWRR